MLKNPRGDPTFVPRLHWWTNVLTAPRFLNEEPGVAGPVSSKSGGAGLWKRVLLILAGGAILLLIGAGAFIYGGFYNVAASVPHNPVMRALLDFGMRRSVAAHAPEEAPPPLVDPSMIARGLRHFEATCATCHGAPGIPRSPVAAAMLPQPPDLRDKIARFNDNEIFWIIRHGLKYTGMPGWPADRRDDEVWDVVAFVRLLPAMTVDEYAALAAPPTTATESPPQATVLIEHGPADADVAACARCHGIDGTGRPTGAFPRLDGLSPGYIAGQLEAFANGRRPSGFMRTAVAPLDAAERAVLAAHYGAIPPQGSSPTSLAPSLIEEGRRLAGAGIPDRAVPACASCHLNPDVEAPLLNGQNANYLATQLLLFREGVRSSDAMNAIADGLADTDIAAVAAYFASLPRL